MNTLSVQKRDLATKAKKIRQAGFVTGNVFGKNLSESIPIQIDKKDAEKLFKTCHKGSKLKLSIDGKAHDVLLKEVNYNIMKREILELDFQVLVKGELINSVAEIVLHNKDKANGGTVDLMLNEVAYKAKPDALVETIEIDCATLHPGDTIKVSDLDIFKNKKVEVTSKAEAIVLAVVDPKKAAAAAEETEEVAEASVSLETKAAE